MNETNQTQLKYITRNGTLDSSFAVSVRKQQAKRYATQLLKTALWGSIQLVELSTARLADGLDKNTANMDKYRANWGITEPEEQVSDRKRNSMGMFVAN